MKKILVLIIIMISVELNAVEFYEELAVGYCSDLAVTLGVRMEDSSSSFPLYLQVRGGAAYQFSPGNADDARKIFINDNTGGSVEEFGLSYMAGIDVGWKVLTKDSLEVEIIASGLLNHYEAHFAFIGNNEAFTVKTTALGFGLGGGLRIRFSENRSSLIVKGGLEFFPKTRIDAHGTFYYNPDGQDDNPRLDYTYEDADGSINQPFFRPYVMAGILFPVGK